MAAYKTGHANVTVGSASVRGDYSTEWDTYVSSGYLFKVNGDANFYEVAAVNNASSLTLSSRYADSSNRTSIKDEHIATSNVGTKVFSGYLSYTPPIQNNVKINASYEEYTDNGAGVLTGVPTGSGNIDYDSGHWTINMAATHNASVNITATYLYGNNLTSLSYQIVTDYTPNYSFPEMGSSDLNITYFFTKTARLVDAALYNASINAVTASEGIDVTATNKGLTLTSPNGSRYLVTVSNTGTVVATPA